MIEVMSVTLHLVGDPEADALLAEDPFALLIGMLLDQQVPMESAFAGPKKLVDRLGDLKVNTIAAADPEEFAAVCATTPAVHRFPGSMAKRIQGLAEYLVENYDGKPDQIWRRGDPDGAEELKARIFLALLGKQMGVTPEGWRSAAGAYGDEGARRSIADVVDAQSLLEVREFKKAAKAAAKKK